MSDGEEVERLVAVRQTEDLGDGVIVEGSDREPTETERSRIVQRGIVFDLVGIVLLVFVVTKIWELFGLV